MRGNKVRLVQTNRSVLLYTNDTIVAVFSGCTIDTEERDDFDVKCGKFGIINNDGKRVAGTWEVDSVKTELSSDELGAYLQRLLDGKVVVATKGDC